MPAQGLELGLDVCVHGLALRAVDLRRQMDTAAGRVMSPSDSGQSREQHPPSERPSSESLISNVPAPLARGGEDALVNLGAQGPSNDLAPFVHQYLRDYINLADQKAAFVFAAATALIVYAETVGAIAHLRRLPSTPREWAGAGALVLLCLAALAAVAVIRPRLKGRLREGVIYWDEIRASDLTSYIRRAATLSQGAVQTEILSHSYVLAGVAQRKYGWLALSLWTGIAGFGLLLGYMLLPP